MRIIAFIVKTKHCNSSERCPHHSRVGVNCQWSDLFIKLWLPAVLDPILEALDPFGRPGAARLRGHGIIGIQEAGQNGIGIVSYGCIVGEVEAETVHVVDVFGGELRENVGFETRAFARSG